MSDRTPALIAAQAASLSARTNQLSTLQVDDMRTRAEVHLDRDDPLRAAMIRFAIQFEQHHRDPYALRLLGEELDRAIAEALSLTAPVRHRRDIDD